MGVGERLRDEKDRVLRLWAERARDRVPAARRQDPLLLVNDLPALLDAISTALSTPSPERALADAEHHLAVQHGRNRALTTDWSLGEVIAEYQVLRRTLFEVLEAGGPIPANDRDLLLDILHVSTHNAAAEFDRLRRREQDRQLALSEQRFAQFVESVSDYAIFTVDPLGFITSWNAGAQRMKQYTPQEAIGQHYSMLYPEEGRRRDEPMGHLRAAEIEGRFRGEGVRLRKNGEQFLADVCITPLEIEGKLQGFAKVVQDLTERNLLMQERDLSRTEAERLRIAAQYRERFVQTLTHDLRTPLQAAKASATLISRTAAHDDKVRRWAERISDAVDRSDGLISDLLDAARIDAGEQVPLRVEACDLLRIAQEASDELRTRHGDRFEVVADGSPEGFWDAHAMRRVFDNLLSNAVKYGEPGTLVGVAIHRIEGRVLVAVHNRGTVMSSEEQAKLFQPFHRTESARRTNERGWGLGLTVVRGIVEAHRGVIKVESYPKEGTTFTVDLPVDSRPPPK